MNCGNDFAVALPNFLEIHFLTQIISLRLRIDLFIIHRLGYIYIVIFVQKIEVDVSKIHVIVVKCEKEGIVTHVETLGGKNNGLKG